MKFVYVAFFLFLVLVINWYAGKKNTFNFLLLVFASSLVYNANRFTVKVGTPEILQ